MRQPVFERIRVQMVYPCAAKCLWCRTHLKNERFLDSWRTGRSDQVHDFYLEVAQRYRPNLLYLSGGEALLTPSIADFVREALKSCRKVCIYTSYQYGTSVVRNLEFAGVNPRRIILAHSVIHFLPDQWHELTQGFPHDVYVRNLLAAKELPYIKRVKFVLNHEDSAEEVRSFIETVQPDDRFQLKFKLMNEQNNGFGQRVIHETKGRVRALLSGYDARIDAPDSNIALGVRENNVLEHCEYRRRPVELRFAYWKDKPDGVALKVRFCPYFGADTHHRFVVGRDDIERIDTWFEQGTYRRKCDSCRLLHYSST